MLFLLVLSHDKEGESDSFNNETDFNFNNVGQGLKILTPNQMHSRLPISLAQLNAGNNSEKLKNEIMQLLYYLYRSNKIQKIPIKVSLALLKMETNLMNTENGKTNESNKFIYHFTDKLNLKNPNNKNIGLVNLSILLHEKH